MNYILTMSLSGSCLFILYQGVRLCIKGMLPEGWYYGILKVVMLYFLLPLPWLKKGYLWLAEHLEPHAGVKAVINYSRQDWVLLQGENGWRFNDTMRIQVVILGVWMGGAVIAGLVLFVYYLKHKRKLQSLCEGAEKEASGQMTDRLVTEMDVRVPVRFLQCSKEATPVTVGFLKPIVFYYAQASTEEKEMMLKHELMHIKRKDMVWRFLSIVLVVMHWYNPIAWWYRWELENVCESSCDERVLQGQSADARKTYAKLIIKYATNQKGEILGVHLSKGAKEVEERMKRIFNKTKKLPKVVGILLAVVLVVLNSATVFAYEDVKVYHADVKIEDIPTDADIAFVPKGEELVWTMPDYITDYVKIYDKQFVDKAGNVYEVLEDAEACNFCEHEFVEGLVEYHTDLDDGGCVVYFYNANRCVLCGHLTDIVLVGEYKSVVCSH